MGGANTKPERALSTSQQGVMGTEVANAGQDRSQMMSVLNPVIGFEQGLTSGDSSKVTEAAAPLLKQFTEQFAGAKQNIQDTAPRGAGRDFAESMLPVQQSNATAGALSNAVMGGFGNLTNIASGLGQYGLGELGAGLRAGEGASQSNESIMQAQAAKHAATMGFLGDLVGMAGKTKAVAGISDRRLKTNIKPLRRTLEKVRQIGSYTFDYIGGPTGQIGVMAQEVLPHFPELVFKQHSDGMYAVNYPQMAAVALQAIRDLAEIVDRQQKRIEQLEAAYAPAAQLTA